MGESLSHEEDHPTGSLPVLSSKSIDLSQCAQGHTRPSQAQPDKEQVPFSFAPAPLPCTPCKVQLWSVVPRSPALQADGSSRLGPSSLSATLTSHH